MAYGNLPGGGYSGFVKAEQPLAIKKRSYLPIAEWPEDYKEYLEEIPSREVELEEESLDLRTTAKNELFASESKRKRASKEVDHQLETETDSGEDEDFDRANAERPKKKYTKGPTSGRLESKEKKASLEEFPKDFSGTVSTEKVGDKSSKTGEEREKKVPNDQPSYVGKRKHDKAGRFTKGRPRREARKTTKAYSRSILKKEGAKEGKRRKGPKKSVTFDDENLEDYSEATSREESDVAEDDIAIEIEDMEDDEPSPPSEEDEISGVYPEVPAAEEEPEMRIKFRRPRRVPTYTYCKRKRSIFRFSPCADRLLYSRRMEYRGWKATLGFPIGALFGFALYWIVLNRINAERYYCWLLGICVGTGFALSTQVRCICFLSIPACCGRAGRAFVSTYVVAYVIEGPLTNILANAKESMRVISCTTSLNLNHTVERFKLMFKPVKEIVVDFVGAGEKVQDDTKQLEEAFTDIEKEVRDENEVRESMADTDELDNEVGGESRVGLIKKKFSRSGRKSEFGEVSDKKYGMKSEFRCEGVFNKGIRGCYDSFEKAHDRCHSYLPIIGYLLCWPMKLTFICDMASSMMGRRACDTNEILNPGFGASVDTADGVQSEFNKDFAVQLQYKLTIPDESVDQLVPEDVSGAMKYSFERRKRNLEFFGHLVDRTLALFCLLVINSSRKYCNQYLRAIQFDNKYVTSYFRHIDARRQKKGKLVLLPLKKGEKLELSDPFSVKFSADERVVLIMNGIRLTSEVLTVSVLLMFDRIFYEFLDLIKRHAHVTYKQTGEHRIKMTIYGDGFVGNMVRGILKGFDKKHSLDQVTTTEECLPLPTKLPQDKIIRLYIVFLLLLVLVIVESYALRLRRVVCAFFYPKREKRRILFLYNDRLKKRRSFLRHMRHRVRKQAREQAIAIDSGVFFSLRKFYPKYFGWVSKLGLGLSQCLICNEKESRKCRLIDCLECPFSYCSECWQDTEGKCYVCLPDDDTEPSDDASSDE